MLIIILKDKYYMLNKHEKESWETSELMTK